MERRAVSEPTAISPGSPEIRASIGEARVGDVTFIGNATALLRIGAFTLLTDPNFSHEGDRARLGYGLRSRRLIGPSMEISDLPELDAIVLSHHHGDHFDDVVARELDRDVRIASTPHAVRKLRRQGFRHAVSLRTWQSKSLRRGDEELRITAVPGKHSPRALSAFIPPVMGSMLELVTGGRVTFRMYVTGDTVFHDRLAEIPERYPDIDVCLIHLGGTRIAGVLLTMDGAQGARALELVRPRTALPVHYEDYAVFKSPLRDFLRALEATDVADRVHVVPRGNEFPIFAVADRSIETQRAG
ncbi:MAG: MBL fold metallo-hydrolase [Actinomycetota bacterium]